jgi:hypothetical protein
MIDRFREQPKESLERFFPPKNGTDDSLEAPTIIRALTWMFLPPEESKTRKKLTQGFTRAALWCLKVR